MSRRGLLAPLATPLPSVFFMFFKYRYTLFCSASLSNLEQNICFGNMFSVVLFSLCKNLVTFADTKGSR